MSKHIRPGRSAKYFNVAPSRAERFATRREEHEKSPGLLGYILRMGYDDDYEPAIESTPTAARCGSVEKVLELARRVLLGQDLFHPNDNPTAATTEEQRVSSDYFSRRNENERFMDAS